MLQRVGPFKFCLLSKGLCKWPLKLQGRSYFMQLYGLNTFLLLQMEKCLLLVIVLKIGPLGHRFIGRTRN